MMKLVVLQPILAIRNRTLAILCRLKSSVVQANIHSLACPGGRWRQKRSISVGVSTHIDQLANRLMVLYIPSSLRV
jgi:hypothetical protein